MSSTQLQDRIVQNLIRRSPVELKSDPPIRHHEEGPAFAFYMVACMECQRQMKPNWIRLSFVDGQEPQWESDANERVNRHVSHFHGQELNR